MLTNILLLVAGFFFLIYGAEYLVKGSASLARRLGVRAFVIGLTVVAFGTSAPELFVNLFSVLTGTGAIAVGNILGSNIANILLILGVCALITPVVVSKTTSWRETLFLILGSVVLLVLGLDVALDGIGPNALTRIDGLVLLLFFSVFLYYTFVASRADGERGMTIDVYSGTRSLLYICVGLGGLLVGGKFIVDAAISIATTLGISEHVIGLTVVALGTSLPELATGIVAARRNQVDLLVGNVVGSNIFNVFFILGVTALVGPLSLDSGTLADVFVVLGVSFLLFFVMFIGKRYHFTRVKAWVFLVLYLAWVAWKVLG